MTPDRLRRRPYLVAHAPTKTRHYFASLERADKWAQEHGGLLYRFDAERGWEPIRLYSGGGSPGKDITKG